jgi:hypothetical protein
VRQVLGARTDQEYRHVMFDVGLIGLLGTYVAGIAWRALWGAPPARPMRFVVALAVSMAIHLGFHAAATAAPSVASAAALVLAGWTSFMLWCIWLGRVPSRGLREGGEDDDASGGDDGGGGGPGPGDGPQDDEPPADDGPDVDWDRFEEEFAAYVERSQEAEPAAD